MDKLLKEIRSCTLCKDQLPHKPNPIVASHRKSRIAIIGQAPGRIVHTTGIPWNDQSGDRLREWLDVDKTQFYNPENFSLIPMGFCYPGKDSGGDLPPRRECAPAWHDLVLSKIDSLELIILIGAYAQAYYLKGHEQDTLTKTVDNFKSYLPRYFVLPHPSPRNNIWLRKNPWFETELLPVLQEKVKTILSC